MNAAEDDKPNLSILHQVLQSEAQFIADSFHLDSVSIIATYRTPDGLTTRSTGDYGNYYARIGALREVLKYHEEKDAEAGRVRGRQLNEE